MLLRTAVLEDRFKSIDQAHLPDSWPAGMTPYYYGAAFHRFLRDRYGEEKIAEWSNRYSARLIPFFIESNAEDVFGRSLGALWWEWKNSLQEKYRREAARLKARGNHAHPHSERFGLLETGSRPFPRREKNRLHRDQPSGASANKIPLLPEEGSTSKRAGWENSIKRNSDAGLSWSPDGKSILFSQMEVFGNFSTYSDLYRL
ncbi:MAG: hypothetical protein MPW15_13945 [Candidatus Manganitrophus sp.]|nr:hypothetical protein [Candidatus Manganitrophus sp.]